MPRRSSTVSDAARILHIDAFSGMAGNMFAGALLDLGLARRDLAADLAGLGLEHSFKVRRVRRGALAARYVEVGVAGRGRRAAGDRGRHAERRGAERAGQKEAAKAGAKGRKGGAGRQAKQTMKGRVSDPHAAHHPRAHAHGRSWPQIAELLEKAQLRPAVRGRALAIFEALGHAEARVHGVSLDEVHFHEVGAVDAIVDVTAAASGIDRLGIERVTCSPVAVGHGHVHTEHGLLPLPAPATLELLRGVPTVPAHVAWETITPTGAAILRTLVEEWTPLPAMTVEAVGYGAGDDREGPMPNVVRLVMGHPSDSPGRDRVTMLETNLDDLVPEHFDHLMERLFDAGALDVSLQHAQMKKNRPGFLVRVLARPADRQSVAYALFAESSAIGIRFQDWERVVLQREQRRIDTPWGRIRVKVVRGVDGRAHVSAEYDDCKRAAKRAGVPLREVVMGAEQRAREAVE